MTKIACCLCEGEDRLKTISTSVVRQQCESNQATLIQAKEDRTMVTSTKLPQEIDGQNSGQIKHKTFDQQDNYHKRKIVTFQSSVTKLKINEVIILLDFLKFERV